MNHIKLNHTGATIPKLDNNNAFIHGHPFFHWFAIKSIWHSFIS